MQITTRLDRRVAAIAIDGTDKLGLITSLLPGATVTVIEDGFSPATVKVLHAGRPYYVFRVDVLAGGGERGMAAAQGE